MNDWKNKLLPASFRNAPFHIEAHSVSGGRNGVHHSFTKKDEVISEDLSKKAREFSFNAFVLGADYFADRDRLISALEEPGLGTLVHPYLGSVTVAIDYSAGYRMSESSSEGRVARFQLNFVRSDETQFPKVVKNTDTSVSEAVDLTRIEAAVAFEDLVMLDRSPEFVRDAMRQDLADLTDTLQESASIRWAADNADFQERLNLVSEYATAITLGATAIQQAVTAALSSPIIPSNAIGVLEEIARGASITRAVANSAGPMATPWRKRQATNHSAFKSLVSRNSTASLVQAVSAEKFDSFEDAIGAMNNTLGHLDREIGRSRSARLSGALEGMRSEFVFHMQDTSADLARKISIFNPVTKPSLVMAYEIYEDLGRASEITKRNKITHPNRVPGGEMVEALNV
jgi:prophage DNA circulation protein